VVGRFWEEEKDGELAQGGDLNRGRRLAGGGEVVAVMGVLRSRSGSGGNSAWIIRTRRQQRRRWPAPLWQARGGGFWRLE